MMPKMPTLMIVAVVVDLVSTFVDHESHFCPSHTWMVRHGRSGTNTHVDRVWSTKKAWWVRWCGVILRSMVFGVGSCHDRCQCAGMGEGMRRMMMIVMRGMPFHYYPHHCQDH